MHRKQREGLPAHQIFIPKDLTGNGLSRFGSGTCTTHVAKAFGSHMLCCCFIRALHTLTWPLQLIYFFCVVFQYIFCNHIRWGKYQKKRFLLAKVQMSLAVWSQEIQQDHGSVTILEKCVTRGRMVNLCASYYCSQNLLPNLKKQHQQRIPVSSFESDFSKPHNMNLPI